MSPLFSGEARLKLFLLAALALVSLIGCRRGGDTLPDVTVDLEIAPQPPQIGPATIILSLRDADGRPIEKAQVSLEGNMNHAGMMPVFADATEVAPGVYEAPLEFTMGGDWFILVTAMLPDGRSLERKIDVPGVDAICGETPGP